MGLAEKFISRTAFFIPSTLMSKRKEKQCWCTWLSIPGATIRPYSEVSPGATAEGNGMPVAFTSTPMVPSW